MRRAAFFLVSGMLALAPIVAGCATFQSKHDLLAPRPVRAAVYLDRLYLEKQAQKERGAYTPFGVPNLVSYAFDQVVPVDDLRDVEARDVDLVVCARIDQAYSSTTFHIEVAAELEVFGLDGTSLFTGQNKASIFNWNNSTNEHFDALSEALAPVIRDLQRSKRVAAYLAQDRPRLAAIYRRPAGASATTAAKPAASKTTKKPALPAPVPAASGLQHTAAGGPVPIVAVFDLEQKGINLHDGVLDRLTDLLDNQLAASEAFRLVPRSQVRERLFVQKKQSYRLCYDESCQVEIGKELAANKSLSTRILKLGGRCVLTLNLYDLSSSTLERATSAEGGCGEDALVLLVRRASAELSQRNIQKKPATRKTAARTSRAKRRPAATRRPPRDEAVRLQVHNAPEDSRMILFSGRVTRMDPLFKPASVRFPVRTCRGASCRFDDLRRNSYVVVASAPGERIESSWIDLYRNKACKLDLNEQGERAERDGGTGTIRVEGTPRDSKVVLLSRKQVYQRNNQTAIPQDACIGLPCKLRPMDKGSYRIVVSASGYRAVSYPVELSSGRELAIHVELDKY